MAFYRQVWLSFWSDPKIDDDFTPEDKYFYLYLLTNPQTNVCGCYEVGMKQMERQTGYNADTIKRLLERMKIVHQVIDYNLENKEIYILNWYKYNWSNSGDVLNGVYKNASKIKTESFRERIYETIESLKNSGFTFKEGNKTRPSEDPLKTYSSSNINNNSSSSLSDSIKEIIDYLNTRCNKHYTLKNKTNISHIKARLSEGFTVDDFKTVIDKKADAWMDDPKMCDYLRPETLFSGKFESYLNEQAVKPRAKSSVESWLEVGRRVAENEF